MKTVLILFISIGVLTFFSFRNYYTPANYCNSLVVSNITLQMDTLKERIFKDTNSVLFITMKNISKVKDTGPDYVLLTVMQGKDTIAGVAINGIPLYNMPRSYPAFCRKRLSKLPDLKTIRISLESYCDNIKILQK